MVTRWLDALGLAEAAEVGLEVLTDTEAGGVVATATHDRLLVDLADELVTLRAGVRA